ncbi:hypothetical protein SLEP1_g41163 [Rubroshorea leprosula]|uniref:Uncharacterized protein n=1 Tax=Rubroshorea leprosula TaxID=152421 RepID=A0AAV5L638_9ROSI|nr:hypothetical protein SLEP1_g41163 [Rubroshorea leprosula]
MVSKVQRRKPLSFPRFDQTQPIKEVGFPSDCRGMNVAATLVSMTWKHLLTDSLIDLAEHFEENDEYLSGSGFCNYFFAVACCSVYPVVYGFEYLFVLSFNEIKEGMMCVLNIGIDIEAEEKVGMAVEVEEEISAVTLQHSIATMTPPLNLEGQGRQIAVFIAIFCVC